jgi:hypothetical protein
MAEEILVDAVPTQLAAWRLMTGWCIAYREDGRVCREPAHIVDRQRGGLVCSAHAPAAATMPDTRGTKSLSKKDDFSGRASL